MSEKNSWLFNFSSYYDGGGLRRLIETARWFDQNEGGNFIVNEKAFKAVKTFSNKNVYFLVSPTRLERFFNDGSYLKDILQNMTTPDVYFSYGIPIPFNIGKENWFHISNATSLTTDKINLPLKRKIEMMLLKQRIIKSLRFVQIISGESEYSLNLLRKNDNIESKDFYFHILPNGYNTVEVERVIEKVTTKECYAITVGTYRYKQLTLAFNVFQFLKKINPKLEKFIIIGNKKDVPRKLLKSHIVEVDRYAKRGDRQKLIQLLSNAEYYISASQIENSSIAALEGLILSGKVILSDIPSHREMLINNNYEEIFEENSKSRFLMARYENANKIKEKYSWNQVIPILYEILEKYREIKYR